MKVEKFKNLIIFQLPAGTCCENLSNLNRAIFFSQKSFVCVKIIFFKSKNAKTCQKKTKDHFRRGSRVQFPGNQFGLI